MAKTDLILVTAGSILVATCVSRLQKSAVEGPLTVLDLLVPVPRDPRDTILFYGLSLGIPLIIGMLLGILATEKAYVATLGVALGAFMAVGNAFLRSDTLAPPLRAQLSSVRRVYSCFVLTYGLLGYLGQSIAALAVRYYEPAQVVNNLITQATLWAITLFFGFVRNRTARQVLASAQQQDEKRLQEISNRLAEFLDIHSEVSAGNRKEGYL